MSALDEQVGGEHYKGMVIQPVEFIQKNRLGFVEGNIIKYICRWRAKNGIEDLHKVRHYIDLLIDLESAEAVKVKTGKLQDAAPVDWDIAFQAATKSDRNT